MRRHIKTARLLALTTDLIIDLDTKELYKLLDTLNSFEMVSLHKKANLSEKQIANILKNDVYWWMGNVCQIYKEEFSGKYYVEYIL